jgi:hypothetical protein
MSLDAGVGADIELGGFSLQTMLGMAASLDGIHTQLKELRNLEEAYQFGAVRVKLTGVATTDAAGDSLEIGLGGPQYGRLWQINSLVIGGVLWTTTVAGTALVFLTATKTVTPALPDIVDEAGSLPSVSQYSTGQIIVRHPQHIRLVVLTPTASTQYAAGGWATDMPDRRTRIEVER